MLRKPAEQSAGFFYALYHPPMPPAEHSQSILQLSGLVRGTVHSSLHDRLLYATDASIYQHTPLGVVVPADLEDTAEAIRACYEHGLPILPRGGGTSLAGQAVNEAVVLDLSAHCRGHSELDTGPTRPI